MHIRDELRAGIEQGRYPVGAHLPTEVELCTSYGVSRTSAARALKALESEGCLTRRPSRGGGSIVTGVGSHKRHLIALAMANSGHFFTLLQQQIMQRIEANGNSLVLFGEESLRNEAGWARMIALGGEAIVIQSCHEFTPFMDRWWKQLPFPVFYGLWPQRSYQGAYVLADLIPGSLAAVTDCWQQGFARLLMYEHEVSSAEDPVTHALEQALVKQFGDFPIHRIWTALRDEVAVTNEATALLNATGTGHTILCGSDFLAVTIFKAARQLGWRLGEDYALIGRFNTPWSEMYGFHSISLDEPALAVAVADVIKRRVAERVSVPSRFIKRTAAADITLPH